LRYSNITSVLEFGKQDGRYYIVNQPRIGNQLAELPLQPFDPVFTGYVITQLAEALGYVISQGVERQEVVHPENIWFASHGYTQIGNFEILRLIEFKEARERANQKVNPLYGSPKIPLPQAVNGGSFQPPPPYSQFYSYRLAAIAYQMLSGTYAFYQTPIGVQTVRGDLPDIRKVQPGLPKKISGVFRKALSVRSDQRYNTCWEFSRALQDALK
jgi:hypothetical protein